MSDTTKPNIVILDGLTTTPLGADEISRGGEPDWAPLQELGHLTVYPRTPQDQVIQRARDAQILILNKVNLTAAMITQLSKLQYIGLLSTGTNAVDLKAAGEHAITVCNVPGYSTASVAQHVFALLLKLVNKIDEHNSAVHEGQWTASEDFCFTVGSLTELEGKTLGLVGVGGIGKRVAQIASALGMKIAAAHQSSMARVSIPGVDINWLPLEELLPITDVLTLHCPLTEKTHHLLNDKSIALLKKESVVINTGRGQLIDEQALANALNRGTVAAAGLDVLSKEPPEKNNPLLQAKNCIITPHIAWATLQARARLIGIVANNLGAFLSGKPVNVVS